MPGHNRTPEEVRAELMSPGEECLWSPPYDPRFPNTNQTRRCWVNFIDWQRCIRKHSEDFEPCWFYKRVAENICPNSWLEKWADQMDEGTFPHDFEKDLKKMK